MTNSAFVSFIRRNEMGYAQQIAADAAATQAYCAKLLTAICADPDAKLDKRFPTVGGEPTSLKELRNESLRLQGDFEKLRGNKPFSDRQASSLFASLLHHCVDISGVTEGNPTLKDIEDLDTSASKLCEMAEALKAMEAAHHAGVAEGVRQGRTVKKRTP